MGKRTDSRDRTVAAAERLFRAQGVARTGLREIVEAAGTPRGSLGHHFPSGKEELVAAVVERNAGRVAALLRAASQADPPPAPADIVRAVIGMWREELRRSDYALGCPLVATVVDDAVAHPDVRAAVNSALTSWEEPLAALLANGARPTSTARGLAIALLAAVEGAVVLARARRSPESLDEVERVFVGIFDADLS